jgi:hypothetical protein
VQFNTVANRSAAATDGNVDDDEAKKFLKQRMNGVSLDRSNAAQKLQGTNFDEAMENVSARLVLTAAAIKIQMLLRRTRVSKRAAERRRLSTTVDGSFDDGADDGGE